MARYLIVANQTLSGDQLIERVRRLCSEGPCSFHVVVPATHTKDQAFYTEGGSQAVAEKRLERRARLKRDDPVGPWSLEPAPVVRQPLVAHDPR